MCPSLFTEDLRSLPRTRQAQEYLNQPKRQNDEAFASSFAHRSLCSSPTTEAPPETFEARSAAGGRRNSRGNGCVVCLVWNGLVMPCLDL